MCIDAPHDIDRAEATLSASRMRCEDQPGNGSGVLLSFDRFALHFATIVEPPGWSGEVLANCFSIRIE